MVLNMHVVGHDPKIIFHMGPFTNRTRKVSIGKRNVKKDRYFVQFDSPTVNTTEML